MTWIFALLSGPLALLMIWAMTVSNHNAQSMSEQVRLDAVTLSLCHSRKAFLEESISGRNRRLQILQWEMEATAAACSIPAACVPAVKILRLSSQIGQGIMRHQDRLAHGFGLLQNSRARDLLTQNNLISARGSQDGALTLSPLRHSGLAGLKRETLSPRLRRYEVLFGIRWPQKLVPDLDFESQNRVSARYQALRVVAQEQNGFLRVTRAHHPLHARYGVKTSCSLRSHPSSLSGLKVRRLQ